MAHRTRHYTRSKQSTSPTSRRAMRTDSQRTYQQQIRRAIENPHPAMLTPAVIDSIQRTYGNHFTQQLIQRADEDDDEQTSGWQSAQPGGGGASALTIGSKGGAATTSTTPWQPAQPSGKSTPTTPWQSAQPGGGNTWQAATPSQAAQQQYAPQSAQSDPRKTHRQSRTQHTRHRRCNRRFPGLGTAFPSHPRSIHTRHTRYITRGCRRGRLLSRS